MNHTEHFFSAGPPNRFYTDPPLPSTFLRNRRHRRQVSGWSVEETGRQPSRLWALAAKTSYGLGEPRSRPKTDQIRFKSPLLLMTWMTRHLSHGQWSPVEPIPRHWASYVWERVVFQPGPGNMPHRSDEVLQELSTNPGTNQLLLYLSASAMQCDSSQRTIVFVFFYCRPSQATSSQTDKTPPAAVD